MTSCGRVLTLAKLRQRWAALLPKPLPRLRRTPAHPGPRLGIAAAGPWRPAAAGPARAITGTRWSGPAFFGLKRGGLHRLPSRGASCARWRHEGGALRDLQSDGWILGRKLVNGTIEAPEWRTDPPNFAAMQQ